GQNVLRHHKRQLTIIFDVQFVERSDERIVGSGCDANPDFATCILDGWKVPLQATHKLNLVGGVENPRLSSGRDIGYFLDGPIRVRRLRGKQYFGKTVEYTLFDDRTSRNAGSPRLFSDDHGDGRIGDYFRMESRRIVHIYIEFQVKAFGHHL